MRESIGATWIFSIVIVFIALFSAFLAFSVNYAKAFRVKDGIITRIEKYNGWNSDKLLNDISDYLADVGYNSKGRCSQHVEAPYIGVLNNEQTATKIENKSDKTNYHYCVQRITVDDSTTCSVLSAYYKVTVFFSLSIPGLENVGTFKIEGETKSIQFPNDDRFDLLKDNTTSCHQATGDKV